MLQDLNLNVNNLISQIKTLLQKNTELRTRRELSEAYITLALLHDNFKLDPISNASIEYLLNRIVQKICYDGYYNYYMGFYYLPNKVYNKANFELSSDIYQSNINISCFRCAIHSSDMLNSSLDTSGNTYFFSRGEKIVTAINNFISYPFDFDISAMIYLSLNYYQTLLEYKKCKDTTFNHYIDDLKKDFECLFITMLENKDFSELIKCTRQICAFWNSIVPTNLRTSITMWFSPEKISSRHRWMLYSYYHIDENKAEEYFETYYDMLLQQSSGDIIELSVTIRLLCLSLSKNQNKDISDIELVDLQTDNNARVNYSLNHFFKNYDSLTEQNYSDQDLQKLISFDDATLRKKVAACMKNVDQNELERQISKPHGALEISDLDIKFFEDGELKYLCMPFKTGIEITTPTMSESYMYQLMKPFSHFGSQCLVVLITAKKCSQGLETYIQRMSIKEPSWRIEVIQNIQLCKLLKANSQI